MPSCIGLHGNYHAQAIRHIRHLLLTELAQTLACSLILSRIDYCNAVLHGAPTGAIQKLQRVQNNAARIVLHASSRSHAKPFYCSAALAARPAADHLQVGNGGVQGSQQVHCGLPALSNHGTCQQPNSLFVCHPAAGPAVHQDKLFQACFPLFSTVRLELAAANGPDQRQRLCQFQNL